LIRCKYITAKSKNQVKKSFSFKLFVFFGFLFFYEQFFFWRDSTGNEVDLLIERGQELLAVEIKSGKTINTEFFKNLHHFKKIKADASCFLVYGGNEVQNRSDSNVLGFNKLEMI
jgi:uncharacterized protein